MSYDRRRHDRPIVRVPGVGFSASWRAGRQSEPAGGGGDSTGDDFAARRSREPSPTRRRRWSVARLLPARVGGALQAGPAPLAGASGSTLWSARWASGVRRRRSCSASSTTTRSDTRQATRCWSDSEDARRGVLNRDARTDRCSRPMRRPRDRRPAHVHLQGQRASIRGTSELRCPAQRAHRTRLGAGCSPGRRVYPRQVCDGSRRMSDQPSFEVQRRDDLHRPARASARAL